MASKNEDVVLREGNIGEVNKSTNLDNQSQQTRTGSLQSILTSYDQAHQEANLDSLSRSSVSGNNRERSLTFGSDFDLGLGFGSLGIFQDGGNVQEIFDLDANDDTIPSAGVGTMNLRKPENAITTSHSTLLDGIGMATGSVPSKNIIVKEEPISNETQWHKYPSPARPHFQQVGHVNQPLPSVLQSNMGVPVTDTNYVRELIRNQASGSSVEKIHVEAPQLVTSGIASDTLGQGCNPNYSNIMFSTTNAEKGTGNLVAGAENTTLARYGMTSKTSLNVAHTPPAGLGSSFEAQHFGKRMRTGSISGRLRSMSDLEEKGIIDRNQKGALKDLIIAGDDALQKALDKYEQGDASHLENMIKSGALHNKMCSDIDILGDLDLDFLSMNQELSTTDLNNMEVSGESQLNNTKSVPIPVRQSLNGPIGAVPFTLQNSNPDSCSSNANIRGSSPSHFRNTTAFDGIGELELNEDFGGNGGMEEFLHLEENNYKTPLPAIQTNHSGTVLLHPHSNKKLTQSKYITIDANSRHRSNSLAYGTLLNEQAEDIDNSIGMWMDKTPTFTTRAGMNSLANNSSMQSMLIDNRSASSGLNFVTNDRIQQKTGSHNQIPQLGVATENFYLRNGKGTQQRKVGRRTQCIQSLLRNKEKNAREPNKNSYAVRSIRNTKFDSSFKKKGLDESLLDHGIDDVDESNKEVTSGTGRPRSLSDPNLSIGLDEHGLMHVDGPPDWIGAYSPESRKIRINRFLAKRNHRVWVKKVKYDVRKNFADSRLRVKGRFVKKEDELTMRDLMSLT